MFVVVGAVSYALGPGISVSGSVLYGNWEGGDAGDGDSEGVMFISGISISY